MGVPEPWGPRLTGHENMIPDASQSRVFRAATQVLPRKTLKVWGFHRPGWKNKTYRCLGQIWDSLPKNLDGGLIFSLGNIFFHKVVKHVLKSYDIPYMQGGKLEPIVINGVVTPLK